VWIVRTAAAPHATRTRGSGPSSDRTTFNQRRARHGTFARQPAHRRTGVGQQREPVRSVLHSNEHLDDPYYELPALFFGTFRASNSWRPFLEAYGWRITADVATEGMTMTRVHEFNPLVRTCRRSTVSTAWMIWPTQWQL
jgi:hypothetical protein